MGGLFSGTTRTTTESEPWQPQGDALRDIFTAAGSNYNNRAGTPWYEGELFAGMDPATVQSIQSMMSYTQGRGNQSVDQFNRTGDALVNPNGYNGAIDRFSSAAGADPTQSNIRSAMQYAANPAIDGMIDAASRDVSRNLFENEIPGINRAGTGSGNINSSRAGVAEGVALRGAGDRVADISSSIRGDAYNRGLSMAEGARTTNLNAMGQSADLYGRATGMGLDALQGGNAMSLGNIGTNIDVSRLFQQDAQGRMDADFRRWSGNDSREDDLLARYMGLVGGQNWGGTQTNTQRSTPSIFGAAMGIGSLIGGFGGFGGGG